jgi:hypothetical protein
MGEIKWVIDMHMATAVFICRLKVELWSALNKKEFRGILNIYVMELGGVLVFYGTMRCLYV